MADPLSIAASIAGIISLTDTVFRYVFKYSRNASGAKEDVHRLTEEINAFSTVLRSLQALAIELETEKQPYEPTLRVQHLGDCQRMFERIRKRVKKAADEFDNPSKWQGLTRQLKWPFSSSETKDLLSDISRYKDTISLATSADTMRQLQTSLSQQVKHQEKAEKLLQDTHKKVEITTAISLDTKKQGILDFFMQPDLNPQPNLKQSISLRQATTGNWLLDSEELKDWFDKPGSHLWLNGIPGGGKTVLAGAIIQEALSRNLPDCGRAFFFCDYKNKNTLLPVNILGAIATQLALQNDECFSCLQDYHTELHPARNLSQKPEVDELRARIARMTTKFSQVLIVIDGIDECGEEVVDQVLTALVELADSADNVGMALFSRDEINIRFRLEADFEEIIIEAHTEDIATYVRAEMELLRNSGKLMINTMTIKDEIENELITRARGMFRWVSCQLDYLCEFATDVDRREALKQLPPTLPSSYQRILETVDSRPFQIRKMVQLCLQFIAFFPERLTITELCQIVSTPETLGLANFDYRLSNISGITSFYAKTLTWSNFYLYAARYWTIFASDQFHNAAIFHATKRFFCSPSSPCFRLWVFSIANSVGYESMEQNTNTSDNQETVERFAAFLALGRTLSPLHLASALNLPEICSALVKEGCDVNKPCTSLTPLAISEVSLLGLLEPIVNLIRPDSMVLSMVLPSAKRRNATAQYLKEVGATRSVKTVTYFFNAMIFSWHLQDFTTVIEFLSEGGEPTETDMKKLHAHFSMWQHTFETTVQLESALLKLNEFFQQSRIFDTIWGFDLGNIVWSTAVSMGMSFTENPTLTNTKISFSLDALRARIEVAVRNDDIGALRRYLQDGRVGVADSWKSSDGYPTTLLQNAALHSASRCLDHLLDQGIDPYVVNEDGESALTLMDMDGDGKLLHVLSRHGVDFLKANANGETLWHLIASRARNPDFMNTLIHLDIEASQQAAWLKVGTTGMTPVEIVLMRPNDTGCFEKMEQKAMLLINYCNTIPDFWDKHDSILPRAFDFGSIKIIERLMEIGVCPSLPTLTDHPPLHHLHPNASSPWVGFLTGLFPEATTQRHKDRIPLEIYLANVIERKTSLNEAIYSLLSSDEVLKSEDRHGLTLWEYVCQLPDRSSKWDDSNHSCLPIGFDSVLDALISTTAMGFFEEKSGECGLSVLLPNLIRFSVSLELRTEGLISSHTLRLAIVSSRHWNPCADYIIQFLKRAIFCQDNDIIDVLLEHGADVHQPSKDITSVAYACYVWQRLLYPLEEGKRVYRSLLKHSHEDRLKDFCSHVNLLHWLFASGPVVHKESGLRWLMTELTRRGVDIDGYDETAPPDLCMPPLLFHLSRGSFVTAEMLLEMGANVNLTGGGHHKDIVHECVEQENVQFLRKLLEVHKSKKQKVDWESLCPFSMGPFGYTDPIQMTPFQKACQKGFHGCVAFLLDEANVNPDAKASRSLTALHFAAMGGNTAIINKLIGLGHAVDVFNDTGDTALHFAAENGNTLAAKILIDSGARDALNAHHSTARLLAAGNGHTDIVAMLEEACGPMFYGNLTERLTSRKTKQMLVDLRASIHRGSIEDCENLHQRGCSLNAVLPEEDGLTPLLVALRIGQLDLAAWFLDHGANVSKTCYLRDGLHATSAIAFTASRTNLIPFLPKVLDHYVKEKDKWSNNSVNPFRMAMSQASETGLEILLNHQKVYLDRSMGHEERNIAIAEILNQQHGVLHNAVWGNRVGTVRLLLEHGADVDRLNTSGRSLLLSARTPEMLALLLDFGASLSLLVTHRAHDFIHVWKTASPRFIDLFMNIAAQESWHEALQVLDWSPVVDMVAPPPRTRNSGTVITLINHDPSCIQEMVSENYVYLLTADVPMAST
ncbi:hypothetical protein FSARC_12850 [Fusarium sarcochroum]|uniref:Ankyrin n=1 Tax=Fusarium sarcochroum TaxID=1208366 RepID=A0A8H4T5N7_9HYPO|nr:hypothetical protein FSARC_12850 [Fusarium sarcochroum]